MSWILDNLQLVLVVGGVIAYWINQRAREKAGQDADYDQDGIPDNRPSRPSQTRELTPSSRDGEDPEQTERVRRIQEEIRRKIAERRGQPAPPSLPVPDAEPSYNPYDPVFREEPESIPSQSRREVMAQEDDSAALNRQRELAEQLEQLEERKLEFRRQAQAAAKIGTLEAAHSYALASTYGERKHLAVELRNPLALRRAMVLREILGTPVGLR